MPGILSVKGRNGTSSRAILGCPFSFKERGDIMSVVYNYTKVKRREKRVYSIFNATVSKQGLSMDTIKVCAVLLAIFSVFGLLFCLITGTFWYNPINLASSSSVGYFWMIFVICPIALGATLNTCKIQNYTISEYIKLYFQPKTPLDQNGKKIKISGHKVNGFIERI